MYDAVADDYCYPGTTVLKNKLDLRDPEELTAFEAEVSDARADEELPPGDLDFKHFKAVHRHLFQDVYGWAGEARTVRISKDGSMFCYPENIESEAKKLFTKLEQDNFLQDLPPEKFAEKSAAFLATLNAIHAFREGNGRTQLSFFLLLADQAGYSIGLEELDPEAFLVAMIASFEGDEAPLPQAFARCRLSMCVQYFRSRGRADQLQAPHGKNQRADERLETPLTQRESASTMAASGQSRRFHRPPMTSGPPRRTDISGVCLHVSNVPNSEVFPRLKLCYAHRIPEQYEVANCRAYNQTVPTIPSTR